MKIISEITVTDQFFDIDSDIVALTISRKADAQTSQILMCCANPELSKQSNTNMSCTFTSF